MSALAITSGFDDEPQSRPADLAEEAALGIVIAKPSMAPHLFGRVPVSEFSGRRLHVAEAIHSLRLAQKAIDHVTVLGELERRGTLSRVGGAVYLHTLQQAYSVPELLDGYVDEIVKEVRRRKVWQINTRGAHLSGGPGADPVDVARTASRLLLDIVESADAESVDLEIPTLREFLDVEEEPYDWVIPGLLERGDRLVLTGSEGLGKSELLRQLYTMTPAGLHPLTGRPMDPQDTLVIDCENGERKVRRKLRGLAARCRRYSDDADSRLKVICRPEGLDLTKPEDAGWFVQTVSQVQPALLVTGPIYRLHAGDANDEQSAREVARVLDRARSASNCAVILEGHSPHGSTSMGGPRPVRPVGSSLWLRWPEFGYGLRPVKDFDVKTRVVDFVAWRGDREERDWPKRLKAGGDWPWAIGQFSEHNSWGA